MAGAKAPTNADYFFGRIPRDEAERILRERGSQEGLYLLRESISSSGNYVLSICHSGRFHHYHIERQHDGKFMIQDGLRFNGPIELINHHKVHQDGFLTKPVIPCNRPEGTSPNAWPGVTMLELERCLLNKAKTMGLQGVSLENCFGPQRHHFVGMVARELHKEQPWFHRQINREEADKVISRSGHTDGKYLMRERGVNTESFALSLSFHNVTKHYKIDKHNTAKGEQFAIEDGPKFDSLMDMMAHYHNRADGLLCKLSGPCIREGYRPQNDNAAGKMPVDTTNPLYQPFNKDASGRTPAIKGKHTKQDNMLDRPVPDLPFTPDLPSSFTPDLPPTLPERPQPGAQAAAPQDTQKIYDDIPFTDRTFNLPRRDIELSEVLGTGNFGSVMRGTFKMKGQSIPIAVKTLKHEDVSAESELMSEARVMANLQHRNIVRMIGVCKGDTIMLVLELVSLGPLNKYLKTHREMKMHHVVEIMFQVAEGMAYLESKNFVHRDLAARNVLLVNANFPKISDFGMSRAIGVENNYYKTTIAGGKWPLKWCAPESIYYSKFDSKSDVWSYGVTLWEATSYGDKPYRRMKGPQILQMLEGGQRLEQPVQCTDDVYEVMLQCWTYERQTRPNFNEIIHMLRKYV